jgi:hypothetical protein
MHGHLHAPAILPRKEETNSHLTTFILNLGTRLRTAINLMYRSLYTQEKFSVTHSIAAALSPDSFWTLCRGEDSPAAARNQYDFPARSLINIHILISKCK